jgi:CheY-like chemotaxis protein
MSTRLLLVEDVEPLVALMCEVLDEAGGYSVEVARDGYTALAAARSRRHDVILLDLSLPGLSGWDLLSLLRAEGLTIPIIAVTAHALASDRARAVELGATAYLSKPFEIDALVSLLEQHICAAEPSATPEGVGG